MVGTSCLGFEPLPWLGEGPFFGEGPCLALVALAMLFMAAASSWLLAICWCSMETRSPGLASRSCRLACSKLTAS